MAGKLVSEGLYKELCAMLRWWRRALRGGSILRRHRGGVVPFLFRRFMPLEAMAPGGTMSVRAVEWDASASKLSPTTDYDEFEVVDAHSMHRVTTEAAGYAEDLELYGMAMHPHDVDRWEIAWMPGQALKIHFSADAGFATTDASVAATVDEFYNGYDPDHVDAGITVHNLPISSNYQYEGDSGDKGAAWYDWTNNKYWIDDFECP